MKILKKILIGVAILIAIPLIVALFLKNDYAIERETTIRKPKQEVFGYIKLVKNQENYSKWAMMDPKAIAYKGTDGAVGFVSSWESDKMGKGELQINNIAEGERIDMGLHFIKPMEGNANAYMTTEATPDGQTKVRWGMTGKAKYPMNIMNLCMDKMLGSEIQVGLDNLKNVLEKQ